MKNIADLITDIQEVHINQVLRVQNFLIDLEKQVGQGQYGKVFIARQLHELESNPSSHSEICACKIVERIKLSQSKENLIMSEIINQELLRSNNVVRIRRAIKTEERYFIFMDFCNCSDLKELMDIKNNEINYGVVQKIIAQLVKGIDDMMQKLVIHRDIKLRNMMLHFPKESN